MHISMTTKVQLFAGAIPIISQFAWHYWLQITQHGKTERWEVWQTANNNSTSWGHLHKNLLTNNSWFMGEDMCLVAQWHGELADKIVYQVVNSPILYPYNHLYRYWPGPNSNTYIQTMLTNAGVDFLLAPVAIGKDYIGWCKYKNSSTLRQWYSPMVSLSCLKGKQYHLSIFGLTFGVTLRPFMLCWPLSKPKPMKNSDTTEHD